MEVIFVQCKRTPTGFVHFEKVDPLFQSNTVLSVPFGQVISANQSRQGFDK